MEAAGAAIAEQPFELALLEHAEAARQVERAIDESELAALRTIASVLRRRAVPSLLLDAASARAEEPLLADGVAGGLLIENHGFVAAAQLTHALVAAARRHGAQLVEQSRVRRIRRSGAEVLVDTEDRKST